MSVAAGSMLDRSAVEALVTLACRAPSLHNTQVADPDGHSLHVSCGAAAELTQLALAAQGWLAEASLLPDPADPDLLARFHLTSHGEPNQEAAQRMVAAGRRRSERRVFAPRPVSPEEIERLRDAAQAPAVYAHFPSRAEEKLELAVAISRADRSERDDPAYAAEVAQWVRREPTPSHRHPAARFRARHPRDPTHQYRYR